MEKLTADDLQLERIRLNTLSDRLEQTLVESRSIRELIENAAHEIISTPCANSSKPGSALIPFSLSHRLRLVRPMG